MPKKRKQNSPSEREDALTAREEEIQGKEEELKAKEEEIQAKEEELIARETELDTLAEQLRGDRETFEREKAAYIGDVSPNDLLRLNIGGTHTVTVQRRTLTCVPGSMLASKFSGRWDDSIPKDLDGAFFIDDDYADFGLILRFLRHKAKLGDEVPVVPPVPPKGDDEHFEKLVEYYGLSHSMYPVVLTSDSRIAGNRMLRGLKGSVDTPFNKYSKFHLRSKGVDVDVKTVEITGDRALEAVEVIWSGKDRMEKGVSIHLDEVGFFEEPHFESVEWDWRRNSGDDPDKVVIRSENYGSRWFINGKPLYASIALDSRPKDLCFKIMGKGKFEITDLELGDGQL